MTGALGSRALLLCPKSPFKCAYTGTLYNLHGPVSVLCALWQLEAIFFMCPAYRGGFISGRCHYQYHPPDDPPQPAHHSPPGSPESTRHCIPSTHKAHTETQRNRGLVLALKQVITQPLCLPRKSFTGARLLWAYVWRVENCRNFFTFWPRVVG